MHRGDHGRGRFLLLHDGPMLLLQLQVVLRVVVAVLVKANAVAQPPTLHGAIAATPPKPAEEDEVAATAREAAREQREEDAARLLLLLLIFTCMRC